jgi:uncharacterized membrane protein YqjE
MAIRESSDGTYRTYRGPSSYTSYKSHQTDGMTHTGSRRESWGELIAELTNQSVGLMRDEVALARRELEQKLKTVQSAVAVVAIGAITALIAALSVCAAVIIALAEYVGPWQSALIVGLILGMAAGVAILIGVSRFKRTSLKPEQTIETIEENREWLKEMT